MYIDAAQIGGHIYVSERVNGERKIHTHLAPYVFYYQDESGTHKSIFGDKLKRKVFYKKREFQTALEQKRAAGKTIFESDVPPVFRLLEERYPGDDAPDLNISIIDIESDKDPERGFARVNNPYAIINAVTVYNKWEDTYYTLVVPPENLSDSECEALLDGRAYQDEDGNVVMGEPDDEFGEMTSNHGFMVCQDEKELLLILLELIEDADVLTGWNSEFYDIPYIIQRIRIVLGGETIEHLRSEDSSERNPYSPSELSEDHLIRLCLFPRLPQLKHVEQYGSMEKIYQLYGRVHLDYLDLYRKFTFEELHSYSLDFVLQKEVNQSKVAYEGSLDQLYRKDFRTFVAYNRQDVAGLAELDRKKKMIELANTMAHMAGVTLDKVLGSVVIIEQAVLKRLHKEGMVAFDKEEKQRVLPVPGGFVVEPDKGRYDWICSYDFNSLYPTVIRLVNISPEVIVGQFDMSRTINEWFRLFEIHQDNARTWAQFTGVLEYHDLIEETEVPLTLVIEGTGEEITLPANEWKEILIEQNWSISGNGTVFDLDREGIISTCMTEWYNERVDFKDKKKKAEKAASATEDPVEKKKLLDEASYYDMVQQVKKIFLNSTYGAYLNEFFRFYDPRLGASVTLSGRIMTKHMIKQASKVMTGNYDTDRRAIIYGDTDSVYATMNWYMEHNRIEKTVDNAVELADRFGREINASMPEFLASAFLIDHKRGEISEAGREIVARAGLFKDKKKRYALHVVADEDKRVDKIKIMGMETRRSDTPAFIQKFLEHCVEMAVKHDKSFEEIKEYVKEFRQKFRQMPAWERGSPGRVSKVALNAKKMEKFEEQQRAGYVGLKKPNVHVSVKASNNTNKLIQTNNEHRWDIIRDGDKVSVIYLTKNDMDMDAVAIKVGENYVPEWFKVLPFDTARMEEKLVNKKLFNVLGDIMDWDFSPPKNTADEVLEEDDGFYS